MPPDPGKSPQSAPSSPAELFPRPESSDDDFDDEEEGVDPTSSGYQPLPAAASADQEAATCLDDDHEDEDNIATSRVLDHLRTHMISTDDVPSTSPDAIDPSDHVVQSFQLSNGNLNRVHFVRALSTVLHCGLIVMNPIPDDSEKIKSAMSGFKLPASAIPEWAQVVPEENWKSLLDQRIRDKIGSISPK